MPSTILGTGDSAGKKLNSLSWDMKEKLSKEGDRK